MKESFNKFSKKVSDILGSSWAFLCAIIFVLIWIFSGPLLNFSNTWQLLINTVTSVMTFLAVFIIQSSQNRDTKELNLKVNELLRAVKDARTKLVDLEDFSEEELEKLQKQFKAMYKSQEKKEPGTERKSFPARSNE